MNAEQKQRKRERDAARMRRLRTARARAQRSLWALIKRLDRQPGGPGGRVVISRLDWLAIQNKVQELKNERNT